MQTDYAIGRNCAIGQRAHRKRGGVCCDNRFRARLHRQLFEDFFLDLDLLRRGLDDERDVAQFHRRSRSNDSRPALFRFVFAQQTALHRIAINFFDVGQAAIE